MAHDLDQKIEALVEKYTELLLGESDETLQEEVKSWIIYSFIAKQMPPLVKHWNQLYPEGKQEMMELITKIKDLNEKQRLQQKPDEKKG
ncbi:MULTISPECIES: DUF2573 family protein [Cytobacillus]|uniref:DUF2573 family protein n=1 Tax=Cytobacillus TaxID=2675230 RepID=UPI001CD3FAAE|nr:DUF2573 family protein [Cytobacillus kochii]MCA1027906.1 YusU family protein [Cytobacillus kochii]MCM3324885.1 YusU family protein [Cytobacillus kochii]MCM3347323.1 YusU family protein [Cytobacillus kochii]MDM5209122.1 DUF2573 family protein [Cytobacillus kochii]MDQ0187541.1 hypothetical protein [Cytobacillus kochii]